MHPCPAAGVHALPADYFTLRRFLRARSYDLERATAMWLNHVAWKKDFGVDTILQDFYFNERDEFLEAYPQVRFEEGEGRRGTSSAPSYTNHQQHSPL
eukprot:359303-Chlamydomonas_euryale.AAC.7